MPYKMPNQRILRMQFEDLVYNYEQATLKIRDFLKLGDNPNPKSVFVPQRSMANTQLILKYPQYKKDVEYIESHLSEYLFDFSKYPAPDHTGEMFMGKSNLKK